MTEKYIFFHIGCMRTGSTFLQNIFSNNESVGLLLKSRFFSYDYLFEKGIDKYNSLINNFRETPIIIDSDENYSLGRFKTRELKHILRDYNIKAEQSVISHDITKMSNRIKQVCPSAKIIIVIRRQIDWLVSIYKHDVLNMGVDQNFSDFCNSVLGSQYMTAGNYLELIKIYHGNFGQQNVKVLFYEDLKNNASFFFDELSEFLTCRIDSSQRNSGKKNKSISNFGTILLAKTNLISQKDPGKRERIIYKFLRSNIFRFIGVLSKYKVTINTSLISSDIEESIFKNYVSGNKKVALLLGVSPKMKKYNYF